MTSVTKTNHLVEQVMLRHLGLPHQFLVYLKVLQMTTGMMRIDEENGDDKEDGDDEDGDITRVCSLSKFFIRRGQHIKSL